MHVAVIGAGSAGVCAAKHLIEAGFKPTVYEQSDEIGGTWIYTNEIDTFGSYATVHSSMYKDLISNLPKEISNFPEIPIPEQEASFISSDDILSYIRLYADHFNIKDHIKFQHRVLRVLPHNKSQWKIMVQDRKNKKFMTNIFDAVIVCNGHFFAPNIPHVNGVENFKGKVFHCHSLRTGTAYQDQNVLVIGGGPSGQDIAHAISKHANHVTLSHHLKYTLRSKSYPVNLSQKPDVKEVLENGVEFVDGTIESFDAICLCTGYRNVFPFLSVDCEITCEESYVRPLYKHTININKPTMSFIGLPYPTISFPSSDLQVQMVVKYLTGENKLPSKEEMLNDTQIDENKRKQVGLKKRKWHNMYFKQDEFARGVADVAKISPISPIAIKILNVVLQRGHEDFIDFRFDRYRIFNDNMFVRTTDGVQYINC